MIDGYDEEELQKLFAKVTTKHRKSEKQEKCKHTRVSKGSPFLPIPDSNFEAAEMTCADCDKFMGFVYRRKKTIKQEKIEYKVIIFNNDSNMYLYKHDD